MADQPKWVWQEWKTRFFEAGRILLQFVKNPIEGMRHLPNWDWPFMLVCQAIAAAVAGVAAGIVSGSIARLFTGLIFVPISNALVTAVLSGFFYYTFSFVFQQPTSFQRIYLNLVFAQLPSLVLFAISPILPPLALLGPAATGLLLLVGLVDNLGLDRRKITRLLLGMYAVFVIFWIFNTISQRRSVEAFRDRATPESLDILEREMKN